MDNLVNLSQPLLDFLLPPRCALCSSEGEEGLCSPCQADLPWLGIHCQRCALPIKSEAKNIDDVANGEQELLCAQCLKNPPKFDYCFSAFQYKDPIGLLINQFKFKRNLRYGYLLSSNLAAVLKERYTRDKKPEMIIPVPLHWSRVLRRGFNQATSIAQQLGKELDIPVQTCLKRSKPTPKQQGLNRKQRLSNLKNAFEIKHFRKLVKLEKMVLPNHLALVDDVMTTGATAEAASVLFKKAGVKRVDIWVLARTPTP